MAKAKVSEPSSFKPIILTLETEEEVASLYAVANFTPITDALPVMGDIRKAIDNVTTPEYAQYHKKLNDAVDFKHKT